MTGTANIEYISSQVNADWYRVQVFEPRLRWYRIAHRLGVKCRSDIEKPIKAWVTICVGT